LLKAQCWKESYDTRAQNGDSGLGSWAHSSLRQRIVETGYPFKALNPFNPEEYTNCEFVTNLGLSHPLVLKHKLRESK
jgi:hypothetical protein